MNAKGDANRSVRMTKQRLYQALITLLQQKSLREITVRELTELAGISRGTFYFHYADIYALMDQMEAAQLARLNDLMDSLIPSISQEDAPPALVALFTYMTENPQAEAWQASFGGGASATSTRPCRASIRGWGSSGARSTCAATASHSGPRRRLPATSRRSCGWRRSAASKGASIWRKSAPWVQVPLK